MDFALVLPYLRESLAFHALKNSGIFEYDPPVIGWLKVAGSGLQASQSIADASAADVLFLIEIFTLRSLRIDYSLS
jgi:hypothetical protein